MSQHDYKSNVPDDISDMETDKIADELIGLIKLGNDTYFGVFNNPPIDNNIPNELISDVMRLNAELVSRWLCSAI